MGTDVAEEAKERVLHGTLAGIMDSGETTSQPKLKLETPAMNG
jgi:hypothetical protein